jgi:orotate phosphoribosyltransferase
MTASAPARLAPQPMTLAEEKARLLQIIKQKSLLTGGTYALASGGTSNYYLDLKPTTFDPEGVSLVVEIVWGLLRDDPEVEAIGGLELGAVPIINPVCARSWPERPIAGFVVRKEKKGHGTDQKIDGNFQPNSTVILIDDVTTKGGSVMQAVRAVRDRGARVKTVITIVDRQEGAEENLRQAGIPLVAIFTKRDLLG